MILGVAVHVYWLILPLVIAISLVYAASRHEAWPLIWQHAFRLCRWIIFILVIAIALLLAFNTQV